MWRRMFAVVLYCAEFTLCLFVCSVSQRLREGCLNSRIKF